ncbi:MAG: methyltransferase domain-containing protein [Thermoanaerobaculia bacterium]
MIEESRAMRLTRQLGMERLAWALRRLHCPVGSDALVLEVGSGGNPYARANVLLDAYEETRERHWTPLSVDRPFVFGSVERLPFRTRAFDFVIASHLIEHVADPARVLGELERVAPAGYIEVPDAFMERVNPYLDHRLEITSRGGALVIRKKVGAIADAGLVELYEDRVKPVLTGETIPRHPFLFHVRHYWEGRIAFTVVNPEVDASWPAPRGPERPQVTTPGGGLRAAFASVLRGLLSQRSRNASIDLASLLRCPACEGTALRSEPSAITCGGCGVAYPVRDGLPYLFAPKDGPRT